MLTSLGFAAAFIIIYLQGTSALTAARCQNRHVADSTASIYLALDPPQARAPSFSLVLQRVRQDGSDTLVRDPPFGVDSLTTLPAGLYRLSVRQIGYWPVRDTIRLGQGEAWCVHAQLVRDTLRLEPTH